MRIGASSLSIDRHVLNSDNRLVAEYPLLILKNKISSLFFNVRQYFQRRPSVLAEEIEVVPIVRMALLSEASIEGIDRTITVALLQPAIQSNWVEDALKEASELMDSYKKNVLISQVCKKLVKEDRQRALDIVLMIDDHDIRDQTYDRMGRDLAFSHGNDLDQALTIIHLISDKNRKKRDDAFGYLAINFAKKTKEISLGLSIADHIGSQWARECCLARICNELIHRDNVEDPLEIVKKCTLQETRDEIFKMLSIKLTKQKKVDFALNIVDSILDSEEKKWCLREMVGILERRGEEKNALLVASRIVDFFMKIKLLSDICEKITNSMERSNSLVWIEELSGKDIRLEVHCEILRREIFDKLYQGEDIDCLVKRVSQMLPPIGRDRFFCNAYELLQSMHGSAKAKRLIAILDSAKERSLIY